MGSCAVLSLWGEALDGDIVGGELGASVYKESLDRDGGLRKIAISQALYTQSQTLYCDQDREQLYAIVAANKDVYSMRLRSGNCYREIGSG